MRRAAAIVETAVVDLTLNAAGALEGSKTMAVVDPVHVALTLSDEAGAAFETTITINQVGSAVRKGKLTNDYGYRFYDIPLAEFE
ncbi:MAG: hypothetical protein IPL75_09765 [Acidobacteria bacterium]|nr:hypothetical protein [Acidobacteriota bacterium]